MDSRPQLARDHAIATATIAGLIQFVQNQPQQNGDNNDDMYAQAPHNLERG